MRGRRLKIGSH